MESQTSQTSQTSQNFKISRAEKQKRRRQNLKDTNPEEYRRRQDLENEKRKQLFILLNSKFNKMSDTENSQNTWCFRKTPPSPKIPKGEYNYSLVKRWEKRSPANILNHDPEKARLEYNEFHLEMEKQEQEYFKKLEDETEKELTENRRKIEECNSQIKKRDRNKKWREENPDYGKKWREENAEKIKEYSKKYRDEKKTKELNKILKIEIQKIEENLEKLKRRKLLCEKLLED